MRCLSLAMGWRRSGGDVLFVLVDSTPALRQRLEQERLPATQLSLKPGSAADAQATIALTKQHAADWVVVDGYHFDAAYQQAIKNAGVRLLVVDDYGHAAHYYADLILNQNLYAAPSFYPSREPHTRLLLGTRHALLREQFQKYLNWQREIPATARKVLVTLGGSDPDNVTGKVIEALRPLDVEAKIVIGGSNPHFESLSSTIRPPSSIVRDASNMPVLMAWADIAIAAGGTTSWELAFMGLPCLVMVLAENQRAVAGALELAGAARRTVAEQVGADLEILLTDADRRRSISLKGRQLVDGMGVERVVTHLRADGLTLRRAKPEDCCLVWEWANDLNVRVSAFDSALIPWEDHQKWFVGKLTASNSVILIAGNASSQPVGQVRFDWNAHGDAEVDVSVDRERRGSGLGSALIRRAADEAFGYLPITSINAYVKPDNLASARAFVKAGFTQLTKVTVRGHEAIHLRLVKNDE